ncbi:MAG: universal stress protein [Deltaproteobacteria bacterium]
MRHSRSWPGHENSKPERTETGGFMSFPIRTEGPASLPVRAPRPLASIPRPAPSMRPARVRRRVGPRIVLALFEQECSALGLQRTVSLARALDARVHVLRILPGLTRIQTLFSRRSVKRAVRAVQRTLSANRVTRSWLRDTPGAVDFVEHVAVAHGDFVEQTAAYAATVDAQLIIVTPRGRQLGETVTSLACAALTPVLVAHEQMAELNIVAATDLQNHDYPVLSRAAELARQLTASLVAVHNVTPERIGGGDINWTFSLPQSEAVYNARSHQLFRATERLPVDTKTIVLDKLNCVDAILGEADAQRADLVVVGTRRRGWLDGFVTGSVATQVVNRAQRSVLVLPLADRHSSTPGSFAPA